MPAKDFYHDAVCRALLKDGWTITDDPFRLVRGERDFLSTWVQNESWGRKKRANGSPWK